MDHSKQIVVASIYAFHFPDGEGAPGEGARFVKHHGGYIFQGVQKVRSLHQYSISGGGPDAPEITQRNGDDQRTWTRDDQEHQSAIQPVLEHIGAYNKCGNGNQQRRKQYDRRSIHPGKGPYKKFGLRLAGGGILHQFQNSCNGAVLIGSGNFNFNDPVQIDHPGKYLFRFIKMTRLALSRDG